MNPQIKEVKIPINLLTHLLKQDEPQIAVAMRKILNYVTGNHDVDIPSDLSFWWDVMQQKLDEDIRRVENGRKGKMVQQSKNKPTYRDTPRDTLRDTHKHPTSENDRDTNRYTNEYTNGGTISIYSDLVLIEMKRKNLNEKEANRALSYIDQHKEYKGQPLASKTDIIRFIKEDWKSIDLPAGQWMNIPNQKLTPERHGLDIYRALSEKMGYIPELSRVTMIQYFGTSFGLSISVPQQDIEWWKHHEEEIIKFSENVHRISKITINPNP